MPGKEFWVQAERGLFTIKSATATQPQTTVLIVTIKVTETEATDSSIDTIEPDTTTAGSPTFVAPFFIHVCGAILLAMLLGFCIGFFLAYLIFKNANNSGEYNLDGTGSGSSSSSSSHKSSLLF